MTLANRITTARFFVTIAYFVLLAVNGRQVTPWLLNVAFVLYLAASIGDALDGYYARKYGEETNFGRIADPFVDKITICGSFVFFLTIDPLAVILPAWMVVVILGREFLVTGIRSAAEAQGVPFGANAWGKWKMVVQSSVVGTAVCYASFLEPSRAPSWLHADAGRWTEKSMAVLFWITMAVTAASGVSYVAQARRIFSGRNA